MLRDDLAYFRHRAETELEQAQQAISPAAVAAHHQLAEAYMERIAAVDRGAGD